MTPNALDALKEQREQLWSCIDAVRLRRMAQRAEDLADRMAWSQRRAMRYARFAERCRHALANNAKDET